MKTTKRQDKKTDSADIKTDAKQVFISVNGTLIHINCYDNRTPKITTYNIKNIKLNTSIETDIEISHYDKRGE